MTKAKALPFSAKKRLKWLRSAAPLALSLGFLLFAENTALEAYDTIKRIESSRPHLNMIANRWVVEKVNALGGAETLLHIDLSKPVTGVDLSLLASGIRNLLSVVDQAHEAGADVPANAWTAQTSDIQLLARGVVIAIENGNADDTNFVTALGRDLSRLKAKLLWIDEALREQNIQLLDIQADTLVASQNAMVKMVLSLIGAALSILTLLVLNRRSHRDAEYRAEHDLTTGLMNRLAFERWIERYQARGGEHPYAVVLLDLDDFKEVNDELGHMAGDAVLRAFVGRIQRYFGAGSDAVRWGGDEFLMLVPTTGFAQAGIVTMLRAAFGRISTTISYEGTEIAIRCSAGAALCPHDSDDLREALQFADLALYKAKERGKGRLEMFDVKILEERQQVITMRDRLRSALREGELALHWQPQVNVRYPHVPSAEALLRWHDRRLGRMISPGEFIPAAEKTGLIIEIDNFVLGEAVRTAAHWAKKWQNPPVVAVNISALHFRQREFVGQLQDLLRLFNVHPSRIELEITEGMILGDNSVVMSNLERLEQLGVRVALDDFGTGYSNMSYLLQLKPDRLKIDQSFVRKLGDNSQMRSMIAAIIGIGQAIDCEVVAEGVETADQLKELEALGCQLVQGYYFARPMPIDQFETWRDAFYGDDMTASQQLRMIADRLGSEGTPEADESRRVAGS